MSIKLKIATGFALMALVPTAAMAHTDLSIGINLGGHHHRHYYEPAPVYVAPPPRVVYVEPEPVYVEAPVVAYGYPGYYREGYRGSYYRGGYRYEDRGYGRRY